MNILDKRKLEMKLEEENEKRREEYKSIGYVMCEACRGKGGKQRAKAFIECEKCHGDGGFKIKEDAR